jgi:hypothetical protein
LSIDKIGAELAQFCKRPAKRFSNLCLTRSKFQHDRSYSFPQGKLDSVT